MMIVIEKDKLDFSKIGKDFFVLYKNNFLREAAKECRRKKKEYVKCLENRVAVLENQNKALIEELKTLKELYCRKEKAELSWYFMILNDL